MDGIIVVVDFRESRNPFRAYRLKTTTRMTTKTRRTPQDATLEYECYREEEEEVFEGGIVKPDLETYLKSLHPFAISIRRLSKRLGEDNVFVVVTHCGDDYVDKRLVRINRRACREGRHVLPKFVRARALRRRV